MNNFKNNLTEPISIFISCVKLLNDIKNENSNYDEVINDINLIENVILGTIDSTNEDVLRLNNYMYEKYIKNKINTSTIIEFSPENYVSLIPPQYYKYDLYLIGSVIVNHINSNSNNKSLLNNFINSAVEHVALAGIKTIVEKL